MKTTFNSADLKMSILSNVRRCWLAMPPVAGFLEMFAGVPYNRERKNKSLICNPPACVHASKFALEHPTNHHRPPPLPI